MKSWDWSKIILFFTYEWKKKMIALILSLLLFYYVNSLSYVEQSFTAPIQFRNLPENYIIIDSSDNVVSFNVKGKAEKVKNLEFLKNINPVVNLEKAIIGQSNYQIEILINTPQPDLIINLSKDKVTLKIDQIVEKTMSIKPSIVGTPKEGYMVDDIFMDKKFTLFRGPLETIEKNSNGIETIPIDISDVTNDISQGANFKLPKFVNLVVKENINITIRVIRKDNNSKITN